MKTRKLPLAALSVAILFASCSKEDVINNSENSLQNQIGFTAIGSNAQTKAAPITTNTIINFAVFAFSDDTYFMGGNSTTGVKVSKETGEWDYEEKAYWPASNPLNFYAVSPWHAEGDNTVFSWNVTNTKQTISYQAQNEFTQEGGSTRNVDVMYGIATSQTARTNGGVVKFNFKHILSQVLFKAKVQYASMSVEIRDLAISNVKNKGEFTFPTAGDATKDNWDMSDAGYAGFKVASFYTAQTINSVTDAEWISDTDDPLMLIPQALTKWNVSGDTKSIVGADNANQSYLKIVCTIKQNGIDLFSGDLYVPFGDTWEPGKRYIYTLIFGGGYDEDGDPILKPIEFDAEVTDWVEATNDINTSEGGLN